MKMRDLPDAILLRIFGCIRDGDTLLDGVALVCKRWNALSRDPLAWSGVALARESADEASGRRLCRVLRRAPALRSLALGSSGSLPAPLSCFRGLVTGSLSGYVDADDVEALHDILLRSRDHLRKLDFQGSWNPESSDLRGRSLAAVVATLSKLHRLSLKYCGRNDCYLGWRALSVERALMKTDADPAASSGLTKVVRKDYAGELVAGLPHLRHLSIDIHTDEGPLSSFSGKTAYQPASSAVDLLHSTAPSLLSLDLRLPGPANAYAFKRYPELEASLARCAALRELSLDRLPSSLDVVRGWRSLVRLRVRAVGISAERAGSEIAWLGRFLDQCAALRSLRRLEIDDVQLFGGCWRPGTNEETALAGCRRRADAFRRARSDVELVIYHGQGDKRQLL